MPTNIDLGRIEKATVWNNETYHVIQHEKMHETHCENLAKAHKSAFQPL